MNAAVRSDDEPLPLDVATRPGEEPVAAGLTKRQERRRLLGDAGWVAGAAISQAAAVLVGTRLLTEYLPPRVFGTVALLMGWLALAMGAVTSPVFQAVLRFHPEAVVSGETVRLRASARYLLVRAVPIGAALVVTVGLWFTGTSRSAWAILALLVGLGLVEAARGLEWNLLTAARRQAAYAGWVATEGWARPILAVALVVAVGAMPVVVLGAYLLAAGGVYLVFRRSFVRAHGASARPDAGLARAMLQYGLPMLPLTLVSWVLSLSDRYIIAGLRGVGEAGLYAAAYGLMNRPFMMAVGTLEATLRPVLFDAVVRGEREQERRIFRLWVGASAAVCALMLVLVVAFRHSITALALGPAYRGAAELLPLIALGSFFQALGYSWQSRLFALKRTKAIALGQTAGAIVAVIVTYVLVGAMGLRGAALACPIYFGLLAVIMIWLAERAERQRRSVQTQTGSPA